MGTQKNRLSEMVLFVRPKQMLKLMDKKIFTILLILLFFKYNKHRLSLTEISTRNFVQAAPILFGYIQVLFKPVRTLNRVHART